MVIFQFSRIVWTKLCQLTKEAKFESSPLKRAKGTQKNCQNWSFATRQFGRTFATTNKLLLS